MAQILSVFFFFKFRSSICDLLGGLIFNYSCHFYTVPELQALCLFKAQANACASGVLQLTSYKSRMVNVFGF
jgi:hypothetical protein